MAEKVVYPGFSPTGNSETDMRKTPVYDDSDERSGRPDPQIIDPDARPDRKEWKIKILPWLIVVSLFLGLILGIVITYLSADMSFSFELRSTSGGRPPGAGSPAPEKPKEKELRVAYRFRFNGMAENERVDDNTQEVNASSVYKILAEGCRLLAENVSAANGTSMALSNSLGSIYDSMDKGSSVVLSEMQKFTVEYEKFKRGGVSDATVNDLYFRTQKIALITSKNQYKPLLDYIRQRPKNQNQQLLTFHEALSSFDDPRKRDLLARILDDLAGAINDVNSIAEPIGLRPPCRPSELFPHASAPPIKSNQPSSEQ